MPSPEIKILTQLGYGYNPESYALLKKVGIKKYLQEQLNPNPKDDAAYQQAVDKAVLMIEYNKKKQKTKEERPLSLLRLSADAVWQHGQEKGHYAENMRAAQEVFIDKTLRARYSRWQLQELLADFWHNHFNVNVQQDERIALTFVSYDRDTIRGNMWGSFRQLLEFVAKSPAMLVYLNNDSSKASPANENYARELFELHTLGAEAYKNDLYDQWKDVPKDSNGQPLYYIDEDVYEAARAFTGWTISDGNDDEKGGKFENTGRFHYAEHWHDHYQKRVMGKEFAHHQPALKDGLDVLDIVAAHPATARHICKKLIQKLVSDTPPASLLEKAIKIWVENANRPNQIREVVATIIFSDEYEKTNSEKVKTPFELLISAWRGTNAKVSPNMNLYWILQNMGQLVFGFPLPTGTPDRGDYWLNTNAMLMRWNALAVLFTEDWHKLASLDTAIFIAKAQETAKGYSIRLFENVCGYSPEDKTLQLLANYLAQGGSIEEELYFENDRDRNWLIANGLALLFQLPFFQYR